ncbi:Sir2 family NAD-dependent protein deacetylase [Actinotignum sp. GS-2025e]|uniref:Sir2 family NAD-dependent protein deacetylase n=1 Tax=Actinotignum sp. GS-2025e TaxID=3427278 RepID=UPI003F4811E2
MITSDTTEAARELAELMAGRTTVVIAGAGVSTASGIPDYRGTGSSDAPSIDYDAFVSDPVWQRWVWQRNQETWCALSGVVANNAHTALARFEKAGLINGVATQNVDNLHQKAGSTRLAELHGNFLRVVCVECGAEFPRAEIAAQLDALNPGWPEDPDPAHVAILASADRAGAEASTFRVAPCPRCGGLLKPAVVFFGEALPRDAMEQSFAWAREADVALVVGTSLAVLTGSWVLGEALQHGAACAIINIGPTTADRYADLRVEGDVGTVLAGAADLLGA